MPLAYPLNDIYLLNKFKYKVFTARCENFQLLEAAAGENFPVEKAAAGKKFSLEKAAAGKNFKQMLDIQGLQGHFQSNFESSRTSRTFRHLKLFFQGRFLFPL